MNDEETCQINLQHGSMKSDSQIDKTRRTIYDNTSDALNVGPDIHQYNLQLEFETVPC
jgi:hypothetical protein